MGLELGIVPGIGNWAWYWELGPGIWSWVWNWELGLELRLELGTGPRIAPGIGNWTLNWELGH